MTACLGYQSVYCSRRTVVNSWSLAVGACVLLFVVLVCKVALKIKSTEVGYALAKERQYAVVYDMERRELELQRSVLMRPDTLARRASARLGLAPLKPTQTRNIVYTHE